MTKMLYRGLVGGVGFALFSVCLLLLTVAVFVVDLFDVERKHRLANGSLRRLILDDLACFGGGTWDCFAAIFNFAKRDQALDWFD